jgi:hypothetical protein
MTLRCWVAVLWVLIPLTAVAASVVPIAGAATSSKPVQPGQASLLPCITDRVGQQCSGPATSGVTSKATGPIKTLGATALKKSAVGRYVITVGRTTCSLNGWKGVLQSDAPLAVGENVTLICVDGRVRSLAPAPLTPHPRDVWFEGTRLIPS